MNIFYSTHKFLLSALLILPFSLSAINGYVSFDKNITDIAWDFLPISNTSFKYSESSNGELFLYHKNYGIKLKQSIFTLDLERSIQPKILKLNAESNLVEFFLINEDRTSTFSISFKEQISDPQLINCYTFSTITIGTCAEARLNITNNKPKYDILGDTSLLLMSGNNQSLRFQGMTSVDSFFLDEFSIFLEVTENNFNWISPIEEITTGFIGNLVFDGRRIGDLVNETIKILPQRDNWYTFVGGISFKKTLEISENFTFFYEPIIALVKQVDYRKVNQIPKYNINLKSGFDYNFRDFKISIYGSYYLKNLYGFEHISFNQRSEYHFDSDYGALGAVVTYSF